MDYFNVACFSLDEINVEQWDLSVCGALAPHVFQSHAWGNFRSQSGWQVMYLVSSADRDHYALALLLIRGFGIPSVRVLYVPRGPLIHNTGSDDQEREFRSALQYIKQVAHKFKVVWAKVSPDIEIDRLWTKRILEEEGYVYSAFQLQHRCTFRVDLTGTVEEVYRKLEGRTRYAIRKAEDAGFEFRECTDVDSLLAFYRLYSETLAQANVPAKSLAELKQMLAVLHPIGRCHLFTAYANRAMIAGAFVLSFGGRLWYLYGGSLRNKLAANSGAFLHWKIIEWALANGYTEYDLQGIPCEVEPSDPLFGVYLFKRGFGGRRVELVGEYDYFPNGLARALSPGMIKVYRMLNKLRSQWRAGFGSPSY